MIMEIRRYMSVSLLAVLLLVSPSLSCRTAMCVGTGEAEGERFTDKQIRDDVYRFMKMLLGKQEPTLQNYFDFEGTHSEAKEMVLEFDECECRGWIPAVESEECAEFIATRAGNPDEAPSYYYRFLRTLFKTEEQDLIIHRVNPANEGKNEVQVVFVEASMSAHSLEFYHAGDTAAVALGLVGLSKIDGKSITEIISGRTRKCD